ncbi:unnamed protein product [Linum trigynum]|uniref:RNase H type-1 domain-containing protein n=1 Tax=Linum trigynum TaxID=586398 RepID=A0AAV2F7D9_9ROSI
MLKAFSMNLGGGSITHVELASIKRGLCISWDMGLRKLVIQIDSVTTILLIQVDTSSHPHRMPLKSIRRFLALDWEITIGHVFREGNFVVDYLASLG